jgi:hypothetical protein
LVADSLGRQDPLPVHLRGIGDREVGFDRSDLGFEFPIATQIDVAGSIAVRGHVGSGQFSQPGHSRLAHLTLGKITAVHQNVSLLRQGLLNRCELVRVTSRHRFGIQRAGAQLQCSSVAVRNQMNGIDARSPG